MAKPEFIEGQPKADSEIASAKEFPLIDGKSDEQLARIARGLGRTTHTGARHPKGWMRSIEGQAVEQMMERNQMRNDGGEQNG